MRLLFAGSSAHDEAGIGTALADASRDLGVEVARRGHVVLMENDQPVYVDPHVASGALEECSDVPSQPLVEVHRMRGLPWNGFSLEDPRVQMVEYHKAPNPEYARVGARAGALTACDAVVLLGGVDGTRQIAVLAQDLVRPIVAIATFGGAAAEVFERHEATYDQVPGMMGNLQPLVDKVWHGPTSARRVIRLAEAMAGAHAYFISYAHKEQDTADHVEVLLKRNGRNVLRDETHRQPGGSIPEGLRGMMAMADTFVQLWSTDVAKSPWCTWEREMAMELHLTGYRPRRLVAITLDSTPPPPTFQDCFNIDGSSRAERSNAVAEIVSRERLDEEAVNN